MRTVIRLHAEAPAKPAFAAPCNGCGVCCASEPCPIGVVVSGRLHGRCSALLWSEDARRYRCGVVERADAHLPRVLNRLAPLLSSLALRYISAGSGCDCDVEIAAGAGASH